MRGTGKSCAVFERDSQGEFYTFIAALGSSFPGPSVHGLYNSMKCKLCNSNQDLKKSHIISETFWSGLYDKKHRVLPIQSENNHLELIQKGIREKLLCKECENKFSKWETVLKKDLVDISNLHSRFLNISKLNEKFIKVENIRYKEFKLAILSILWRMSISSHRFFQSYSLGPYDEKLRHILYNELTPKETQFPVSISRYELNGQFSSDIIMGFPPGKFDRIFTVQKFLIWGHCFTIFINDQKFPSIPIDMILRDKGTLYINIRSLVGLSSPKSVFSKLFDRDVATMFEKRMDWQK